MKIFILKFPLHENFKNYSRNYSNSKITRVSIINFLSVITLLLHILLFFVKYYTHYSKIKKKIVLYYTDQGWHSFVPFDFRSFLILIFYIFIISNEQNEPKNSFHETTIDVSVWRAQSSVMLNQKTIF